MIILTIDTAADTLVVGLLTDKFTDQRQAVSQRRDDRLLPLIDEILHAHHLTLTAITDIVVRQGIGSYTGLRIGIATAAALAWAAGIPLRSAFSRTRRPLSPKELFARVSRRSWAGSATWPVVTPRYQHWQPTSGFGKIRLPNG